MKTSSILKSIAVRRCLLGARGGTVVWGNTLQVGMSRVRFRMMSLEFFIDIILPATLWPSQRNEYQEYFLRGKSGRCVRLTTLPPSCADSHEICEPQPPETLRACPGIVLPFYILLTSYMWDGWIKVTYIYIYITLYWHLPGDGHLSLKHTGGFKFIVT